VVAVLFKSEVEKWIDAMSTYLQKNWGIDSSFAKDVAKMFLYFTQYGLSPTITSGYRSRENQAALQQRYAAGDRSIVVKPAENSKHSTTDFLGYPAATAIDISTSNPNTAAAIATALGIGAGLYFTVPDRVHFFKK
jgi:LAS superfamily LD-carboxypeptidase LdcB